MPVSSLRVAGGGSHGPRIKKYAENVWRADVEHDRRVHIAYERQQEQIELEKRQASALNNDTSNGSLSNGSFMSNGTRRNDSTVAIGHVDSIPNGGKDSVAKIVEHPVLSNFGRGHDWDDNPYGDWTTVTWTTTPHRTRKLLEDFEEDSKLLGEEAGMLLGRYNAKRPHVIFILDPSVYPQHGRIVSQWVRAGSEDEVFPELGPDHLRYPGGLPPHLIPEIPGEKPGPPAKNERKATGPQYSPEELAAMDREYKEIQKRKKLEEQKAKERKELEKQKMQEEANEAENPAQNEGEGRTDEYGFARGTPKKTADGVADSKEPEPTTTTGGDEDGVQLGVADSKEPEPTTTTGGDEDGIQLRVADSKESSDLITTRTQVDIQDVEGEEVVDL